MKYEQERMAFHLNGLIEPQTSREWTNLMMIDSTAALDSCKLPLRLDVPAVVALHVPQRAVMKPC